MITAYRLTNFTSLALLVV